MTRRSLNSIALAAAALACLTLPARADRDGRPDHVVVITDSHGIGEWGEGIEAWLRRRSDTTYDFFASGASAPRQWAETRFTTPCGFHQGTNSGRKQRKCYKEKTPHLDELWKAQTLPSGNVRKVTVIAHGSNFAMTGKPSEVASTKKLLKMAFAESDICIWVGPPNMKTSPGFDKAGVEHKYGIVRDALDEAASAYGRRCVLVDSRPISTYPKKGGDGVHYHWLRTDDAESLAEGTNWATKLTQRLENLLK